MQSTRMIFSRILTTVALGFAATTLFTACSEPEVVPSSGPHPVLPAAQVKIYQAQPKKYEDLGQVTVMVTPEMKWDPNGDSTPGFEALKAQAASKGANGLLLNMDPSLYDTKVGAGYQGTFYQVAMKMKPKQVMAKAIYVVEE